MTYVERKYISEILMDSPSSMSFRTTLNFYKIYILMGSRDDNNSSID